LDLINIKEKIYIKVRISDHECPGIDSSDYSFDTTNGEFYVNKKDLYIY